MARFTDEQEALPRHRDRALRRHRARKILPIITVVGKAFWDLGQPPKAIGYVVHYSRSHTMPWFAFAMPLAT